MGREWAGGGQEMRKGLDLTRVGGEKKSDISAEQLPLRTLFRTGR